MYNVVPCCRLNFVKFVEILAFIGSSEPTELDRCRHEGGRGLPVLPLPVHPAEGRDELGSENQGPCKCVLCLPLIL